jgi:hypothetical protein
MSSQSVLGLLLCRRQFRRQPGSSVLVYRDCIVWQAQETSLTITTPPWRPSGCLVLMGLVTFGRFQSSPILVMINGWAILCGNFQPESGRLVNNYLKGGK